MNKSKCKRCQRFGHLSEKCWYCNECQEYGHKLEQCPIAKQRIKNEEFRSRREKQLKVIEKLKQEIEQELIDQIRVPLKEDKIPDMISRLDLFYNQYEGMIDPRIIKWFYVHHDHFIIIGDTCQKLINKASKFKQIRVSIYFMNIFAKALPTVWISNFSQWFTDFSFPWIFFIASDKIVYKGIQYKDEGKLYKQLTEAGRKGLKFVSKETLTSLEKLISQLEIILDMREFIPHLKEVDPEAAGPA